MKFVKPSMDIFSIKGTFLFKSTIFYLLADPAIFVPSFFQIIFIIYTRFSLPWVVQLWTKKNHAPGFLSTT